MPTTQSPPLVTPAAALPRMVEPVAWMLAAALLFAAGNATVRHVAMSVPSLEIVFIRNLVSVAFMLPWMLTSGAAPCRAVIAGGRLGLFASRAAITVTAMMAWYYSLAHIPLPTATAISFTTPLFATLGAALFLHERVQARRWGAVFVGLAGVLIVLRPDGGQIDGAFAILMLHCAAAAAALLLTRGLTQTDSIPVVVVYISLFSAPMAGLPALVAPSLFVWIWPTWTEMGWLLLLGGLLTLAQLTMTRALSLAPASAMMPYDYARLPFSALIAWIAFGDMMDLWGWVGAAVIAGSALYTMHRDVAQSRMLRAGNDPEPSRRAA